MGEPIECAIFVNENGVPRVEYPCENGHTYGIFCAKGVVRMRESEPAGSSRGESEMSDADEVEVLRAQNEFLLNRLRAIRDNANICLPPHLKAPPAPCHHLHRTFGYDGPICQSCGQVIPEMTPEEAAQLAADIAEIRAARPVGEQREP